MNDQSNTTIPSDIPQTDEPYLIAAFYKFAEFPECIKFQPLLKQNMLDHDVVGTILVTPEGINGTVSGQVEGIAGVIQYLREQDAFADLEVKYTPADTNVFERAKVKLKQEAITFRKDIDPVNNVGEYISPEEWNDLIQDPDVILIDTRNHYEYDVGTFKNAKNPNIKHFTELPEYLENTLDKDEQPKVAMFCTGGIRCEKSTAYLREQGFRHVYHLKGGIIKYLQEIPKEQSLWEGDCFVFDERITVDHDFNPTYQHSHCPNCGHKLNTKNRAAEEYVTGERCAHCPPEPEGGEAKANQAADTESE